MGVILFILLLILLFVFVARVALVKATPSTKSSVKIVESKEDTEEYQYVKPERKLFVYDYKDFPSLCRDQCPYCNFEFKATPSRNRMCPSCKGNIIKASIPINGGQYDIVLLNEIEGLKMRSMIDSYWNSIHNTGLKHVKSQADFDKEIVKHINNKDFHEAKMAAWNVVILMKDILTEKNDREAMLTASRYAKMATRFEVMYYCAFFEIPANKAFVSFDCNNVSGCIYAGKGSINISAVDILKGKHDIPCEVCKAYDNDKFFCSPHIQIT